MAVKLSSYYCFRNNYLVRSLEDKHCEREFFGEAMSHYDRTTLMLIVKELDELKDESYFQDGTPVKTRSINLQNITELKDVTSDVELAAAYLKNVYEMMRRYWVQCEMYRHLGRCFNEMNAEPDPDVAEAIEYANEKIRSKESGSLDKMCWKTIKEHKEKEENLKKNDPVKYYNLFQD
ncbi:hypothetical protein HYZ41_01530 [archaeon]|nr:hypothetical protein [archaeon]